MATSPSFSALVPISSLSENLVGAILNRLGNIQTEIDIFAATVEIVHQVLKCDRAVVYSLQEGSYCQVIAEYVTPGYAQLLGQTINDSCFESGYLEKYQKGRVKAVDDLDDSDLSLCHRKTLNDIQVRANLVTPLINSENSLIGLLIVHQCSSPRQWQQSEINFLSQVADWSMGQLASYRNSVELNNQVAHMQQQQQLIDQITQELHQAQDTDAVLQTATLTAQDLLKCDRVVVYSLEDQNIGEIVAESTLPSLAPILGRVITDPCLAHSYKEKYQDGRVRAMDNIYEAGMTACYIQNLEKIAVQSNIVVPINLDNEEIYGLLVVHQCFQFRKWQPEEIRDLYKIALQTGLSLSKTKLKEQVSSVSSNLERLELTRDQLTIAKSDLQLLKNKSEGTSNMLKEINNLHKLLERELNSLNKNASIETKKDIRLVNLFIKKLVLSTHKLEKNMSSMDNKKESIETIVEDLIAGFYSS